MAQTFLHRALHQYMTSSHQREAFLTHRCRKNEPTTVQRVRGHICTIDELQPFAKPWCNACKTEYTANNCRNFVTRGRFTSIPSRCSPRNTVISQTPGFSSLRRQSRKHMFIHFFSEPSQVPNLAAQNVHSGSLLAHSTL